MVFEISHVIHFKRKEVTIHKECHAPTDGAVCAVSITQIKRASVTNRGFEIRGGFVFWFWHLICGLEWGLCYEGSG